MKKNYVMHSVGRLLILILCFQACKKEGMLSPAQADVPAGGSHAPLSIKEMARDMEVPWGMAFLPNGDMLFGERTGELNLIKKDSTGFKTLVKRTVEQGTEGGLLGIAIDPDYTATRYIFIYETAASNQVVRFRYDNGQLSDEQVILSGISKNPSHNGGALRFGPDGFLYVGTGDAQTPSKAQDRSSLNGKILRIDRNGNAAPGNPFNNRVWSYGHRNVQGFDWNSDGAMYATEHGPSIEFGWCCHDEINHIVGGKNYGWPLVMGDMKADTLVAPVVHSGDDTWAPSGCSFIKGAQWGEWQNSLVVATLRGKRLIRFKFNSKFELVSQTDTLKDVYYRLRNVVQGPDGSVYFGTSNVGITPPAKNPNDDKIFKMSF